MEVIDNVPLLGHAGILIAGPSNTGKSYTCMKILANRDTLFANPPHRVMYNYNIYQEELFGEMERVCPNITFHKGLPSEEDILTFTAPKDPTIIVIDDLCDRACKSNVIENLYTQFCHHRNSIPILISHNVFTQSKQFRVISLNTKYFFIFPSPRDSGQINVLAKQMFARNPKSLTDAYADICKVKYGYLLVNASHDVPRDDLRIYTDIFSGTPTVYRS